MDLGREEEGSWAVSSPPLEGVPFLSRSGRRLMKYLFVWLYLFFSRSLQGRGLSLQGRNRSLQGRDLSLQGRNRSLQGRVGIGLLFSGSCRLLGTARCGMKPWHVVLYPASCTGNGLNILPQKRFYIQTEIASGGSPTSQANLRGASSMPRPALLMGISKCHRLVYIMARGWSWHLPPRGGKKHQ